MECGGPRVSELQYKDSAQEGSCQVQKANLKHASTPGGVRRIELATPFSADPSSHSDSSEQGIGIRDLSCLSCLA